MSDYEMSDYGVRCTTAAGEEILVTLTAVDEAHAVRQVREHQRLFYGPGDTAGRMLTARHPDTIVAIHEGRRL